MGPSYWLARGSMWARSMGPVPRQGSQGLRPLVPGQWESLQGPWAWPPPLLETRLPSVVGVAAVALVVAHGEGDQGVTREVGA